MSSPCAVAANTNQEDAATASTSEKSEITARFSRVKTRTGLRVPGRAEDEHATSAVASVASLQQVRSVKSDEHWRGSRGHRLPRPPHVRQRRQDIGGPQAARGPLPRALLGGAAERVRAEGRRVGRGGATGEKGSDESGEQ